MMRHKTRRYIGMLRDLSISNFDDIITIMHYNFIIVVIIKSAPTSERNDDDTSARAGDKI